MNIQIGKRKVIQIQAVQPVTDSGGNVTVQGGVYALADDGTLWYRPDAGADGNTMPQWHQEQTDVITDREAQHATLPRVERPVIQRPT